VDHEPTGDDCAAAAERYFRHFAWPCVADGFAVWALAGQAFDSVDVPTRHGPAVLAALGLRTDVIEVPGDTAFWRFLVRARRHTPRGWHSRLTEAGASHLTNADRIELPPTRVPGGELRWVRAPLGNLSPLHEVVIALTTARR